MIWYRYWLETRQRILLLALVAIWMGSQVPDFAHPLRATQAILQAPLAEGIATDDVIIWVWFAQGIAALGWVATLASLSTGLRTAWLSRDPAIYYTLTLPVSRTRLISTYQGISCVAAILAVALMLVTQCVALLVQGHNFPFIPLAVAIAFAAPMLMAWTSILGALALLTHEYWAILAAVPMMLFSVPITRYAVTAFSTGRDLPWILVAALLAVTVLAFAITLQHARIKEF